jgi:hypothetical protein
VIEERPLVRKGGVSLGVVGDAGGRADGGQVGFELVEAVGCVAPDVVDDGVVGDGPDPGDVEAHDADVIVGVLFVPAAQPSDDVEELLVLPVRGRVPEQRLRVTVARSQVAVDLDPGGPVLLDGQRAEPEGLDQVAQDPLGEGRQLVSAVGRSGQAHDGRLADDAAQGFQVLRRGGRVGEGERMGVFGDPAGHLVGPRPGAVGAGPGHEVVAATDRLRCSM